jgi:hypothetical protein
VTLFFISNEEYIVWKNTVDPHDQISHLLPQRGNQKLVIHSQMLQVSLNMQRIDELFAWLASIFVQRFSIQVVQFWTSQISSRGQASVALETTVCQDASFPQHVVNNAYVAEAAAYLINLRKSVSLQLVDNLFSLHQANLLKRYGLYYWITSFVSSQALLPPASDAFSATPLTTIALLFLKNPPTQDLIPYTSSILEQAVTIAKKRQFLLPPAALQVRLPPSLVKLIPQRLQDTGAMRSRSPFISTPAITDSKAMQLYLAIDGHKSIEELSNLAHMDMQLVYEALGMLLKQNYIQLFDSAGQRVDRSWLLDYL